MNDERKKLSGLIEEAKESGARQRKACEIVGINVRTLQRWNTAKTTPDGRLTPTHKPNNKLSELERQHILTVCNKAEYAQLPPNKIVPLLAEKGVYIASESTFYRILRQEKQLAHRQSSKPNRTIHKPEPFVATAPNEIYSWDITYLPTTVKGIFYYLYLVMDVYSRKIVGWQVHDRECSSLASDLMTDICLREKITRSQVVLHSDNGSPMKGATMLATLQQLGVMPSFSRPSVSNDNPYSESLFRTLKYRPEYPENRFENLSSARDWVAGFVRWYNDEHMHSGIQFVTPSQRHAGKDAEILTVRKRTYEAAKKMHPERWSRGIRNWEMVTEVHLNPEKQKSEEKETKAA